jgi:flagellar basal body-associated protein FliL
MLQVVRKETKSIKIIIGRTIVATIIGGGLHVAFNSLQIAGITVITPIVVLG